MKRARQGGNYTRAPRQPNGLAALLDVIDEASTADELDNIAGQIDALPSSQRRHAIAARAARAQTFD